MKTATFKTQNPMLPQEQGATDAVFAIQESIRRHAKYSLGKAWRDLSARDVFTV